CGQIAMFRDFFKRYRRTLAQLALISADDFVYAVSDYWFDVLPAVRAAARKKLMVLHMDAPSFSQILRRSRPDVDPVRLASFHYWASQEYSLRRFIRCGHPPRSSRRKEAQISATGESSRTLNQKSVVTTATPQIRLFHLHPAMRPRLLKLGCTEDELTCVSYGLDVKQTEAVPDQQRIYDVVWIGRVHRQKGIDDLMATLAHLAKRMKDFRAIFIGNLEESLRPEVQRLGLAQQVEFSGFVSEQEKIRLFKASRLFLMPSRHEGSPRVIGEAIICRVPVVAYEIPNYRPL